MHFISTVLYLLHCSFFPESECHLSKVENGLNRLSSLLYCTIQRVKDPPTKNQIKEDKHAVFVYPKLAVLTLASELKLPQTSLSG